MTTENNSFFTEEVLNTVKVMKDPEQVKTILVESVEKSTAKPENKSKAKRAIQKARSLTDLLFTAYNFHLANERNMVI